MIGIIGGTHILEIKVLKDVEETRIETPYGTAEIDVGRVDGIDVAIIQRHGKRKDKPPHRINHAANFYALKSLGVKYVIGMGSVGALREEYSLPSLIIPHDYIDFFSGVTIYNDSLVHVTPGFDEYLREVLVEVARKISSFPVIDKGVYFQTRGPRLETKAEIAMIKSFADCVGMTAGSEATIARELGLSYAIVCTMDNYAHGIKNQSIDYREIVEKAKENARECLKIVEEAVKKVWEEKIQRT
ncbi:MULTISPECIES: S-methyl-5'-thioadenosine phosphorylase [Archaeoglobus]|jgi:5'-methylthioadenosine phosphorylase|uniref:Probable 6-oxopurine nucleoside phosphorylase n=3 Tax=Archaeoglobus fulgidus TaxID=2234 RepID=PNPH_ARCFU|nr:MULTISPECIES: S-methyl-5'-thioadenosine phosphorylase [Archaeoglobus]O28486.1 RecName: Full=Probable 6-oxopurine nucleoside phosphorylase; AltName: Full=Purine nucleoside phosphorylase; Short=PNP [Archaeoglobus fulgidus DSM 4304]AAB89459.1 methylthioadenosine phosphorylase (mtaP) [Archaeoglobus fulgidus DSM 4304]AIG98789.1 5'-deoxy-5'-methylthioadenosine phosphorylase [Archaeoglobus fulgidus DSM 8774]KUJ93301.1 MAG: putative 6-oxopurine nucleoside phosphorylase [Archaeoglobus fulgidus]KUK06